MGGIGQSGRTSDTIYSTIQSLKNPEWPESVLFHFFFLFLNLWWIPVTKKCLHLATQSTTCNNYFAILTLSANQPPCHSNSIVIVIVVAVRRRHVLRALVGLVPCSELGYMQNLRRRQAIPGWSRFFLPPGSFVSSCFLRNFAHGRGFFPVSILSD